MKASLSRYKGKEMLCQSKVFTEEGARDFCHTCLHKCALMACFLLRFPEQKRLFFLYTYTRVTFLNLRHWFSEQQYDQLSFELVET